jgi:hypothetical protein
VVALGALEARVARDLERHAEAHTELLNLRHDAVGDDGDALGQQAVEHGLEDVELVLNGEVDKVGVDLRSRGERDNASRRETGRTRRRRTSTR